MSSSCSCSVFRSEIRTNLENAGDVKASRPSTWARSSRSVGTMNAGIWMMRRMALRLRRVVRVTRSILLSSTIRRNRAALASGARSISPEVLGIPPQSQWHRALVWRRTSSSTKKSARRARDRQVGGFDDDTIHATLAPHQAARIYEIAAHRTADAAVVHFEDLFFGITIRSLSISDLANSLTMTA